MALAFRGAQDVQLQFLSEKASDLFQESLDLKREKRSPFLLVYLDPLQVRRMLNLKKEGSGSFKPVSKMKKKLLSHCLSFVDSIHGRWLDRSELVYFSVAGERGQ